MYDKSDYQSLLIKYKQLEEENISLKLRNSELEESTNIYKSAIEKTPGLSFLLDKQKALIQENRTLKEKIFELETVPKENVNYTIKPQTETPDRESKLKILSENNSVLQTQIGELKAELKGIKDKYEILNKVTRGLLGYKVDIQDRRISLLSVYAFDEEDVFLIDMVENKWVLGDSKFLHLWKNELKSVQSRANPMPAFFSIVSISLFNKDTFGG